MAITPARRSAGGQGGELVERAALLERGGELQVLELQPDLGAEHLRTACGCDRNRCRAPRRRSHWRRARRRRVEIGRAGGGRSGQGSAPFKSSTFDPAISGLPWPSQLGGMNSPMRGQCRYGRLWQFLRPVVDRIGSQTIKGVSHEDLQISHACGRRLGIRRRRWRRDPIPPRPRRCASAPDDRPGHRHGYCRPGLYAGAIKCARRLGQQGPGQARRRSSPIPPRRARSTTIAAKAPSWRRSAW